MLRKIALTILVASVAATLLAVVAGAGSAGKVLTATGKEIPGPTLDPGKVTCAGGQPTGVPMPPCTPETHKILLRDGVALLNYGDQQGTAADMFKGTNRVVNNCNLDPDFHGHCWGTLDFSVDGLHGKWEGTFEGEFDYVTGVISYHAVGHGNGGELDGLQMKVDVVYPGGAQAGTFAARVLGK